jgi:hypothetical protein
MMRQLVGLVVALGACAGVLAQGDATKPGKSSVEAIALAVNKKVDDKNIAFGFSATTLSLLVRYPGKQFIDVDPSSKVAEFKDDKGTSLLLTAFVPSTFTRAQIGKDRTAMVVTVAGNPPASGATKLHLKGTLVTRCGLEEKTTDEKEVELKMNAEAKVGDYSFKVTQEKGFFGTGATFTVTTAAPTLKSVTAKDADGKAIEVTPGGYFGYGKNWTYYFTLKKEAKKAKLAVVYFSKEEKVEVPVEMDVGVGL